MRYPAGRILVFAKAPRPGRVKTRLARRYGKRGATRLYRELLRERLAGLARAGLCPVELWVADERGHPFFARCRREFGVSLHRQHGTDLGRRMDHALRAALRRGEYALLIGGDCASLTVGDLAQALDALAQGREAVLGPAEDGGYVLLGLRRARPALFRGIRWSTPRVLPATRARLHRAGLDWVELPTRWDVDRPTDVRRLRQRTVADR
ncbi:MAG TPA: TIGR04282 family arsenosugar biosynthesis glycosyltransferase [Candidatus Competibacteraceae bacterium]|nr:TIGR04282 family arsenosugar biosynthesis glycosyltransferase [Candidatus Competibacteraceae bacterium]